MVKSMLGSVLLWIYLCSAAHAQSSANCKDEDCDMRNEYKCEDKRCHKYSFCNSATRKCDCPIPGAVKPIQPVCGTDNKNYSSEVELHHKACMDYSKLEVSKHEPCQFESNVNSKNIDDNKNRSFTSTGGAVLVPIIITCIVVVVLIVLGWLYYQKRTKNKFTINKQRGSEKNDLLTML